jgi:hypothetical protein
LTPRQADRIIAAPVPHTPAGPRTNTDPIQQFAAAFVGEPEDARKVLYGSKMGVPRYAKDWCMVMGMSMLADLDALLNGGYSRDTNVPSGVTLLHPDGPLHLSSKVSRHLYLVSHGLCERLAALTDSRIEEIASHWYRLLYPLSNPDHLPHPSHGRSQHREKVLRSLAQLARTATRQKQSLLLLVEQWRNQG